MRSISALAVCLVMTVLATRGQNADITILHTNDIHGHVSSWRGWEGDLAGREIGGFDRLATAIKQARAEAGAANVLLLDAGDAIGDTMLADLTKGRAIIDLMAALHYDAMALGNHEPDFSAETLRQFIAEAGVPMLASNVTERVSGKLIAPPYLIREVGGVKVGVLALAYPNTALTTARTNVEALQWETDSAAVARRFIPQMRGQGAEIIILLTHLGLSADKQLAAAVPGIDVIVGGHSHNRMSKAAKVGTTLIVQAGAHLSDLGRLTLHVHDGKVASYERTLIPLDHATLASDPEIARQIAALRRPFAGQLEESLGEATAPLVRAQTLAGDEPRKRDAQSPADSLFADILRERTGSEIAFLPGVGYGVAIPTGPITAEMLRNLVPHDGEVVTMFLRGAQVRAILEQAVENTFTDDPERKVGGMIQVSGLRFSYDPARATPTRVLEVWVGEKPLEPERFYAVATNSMLAGGGHNYTTFRDGREARPRGSQFQVIADWIKQHKHVRRPTDVRVSSNTKSAPHSAH